jgi:thymidylate synthase (FAD)
MRFELLDHGYVELIDKWGSDEMIIEAARMSTQKGFLGWGPKCSTCDLRMVALGGGGFSPADYERGAQKGCDHDATTPGDEKLLKYLWDHKHATPFEMAGLTIEVKAPIFVFREWHRHRVPFGYNEMSARYVPMPNENYLPTVERGLINGPTRNKQAQGVGAVELTHDSMVAWLYALERAYEAAQHAYDLGLHLGVPKELARISVPVGRYSVMRATGNLRGWLGFLALRCAPEAQWEIRQFANAVAEIVAAKFPRTGEVALADLTITQGT